MIRRRQYGFPGKAKRDRPYETVRYSTRLSRFLFSSRALNRLCTNNPHLIVLAVYSMMADYEIQMADGDRVGEFYVKFHGPKTSTLQSSNLTKPSLIGALTHLFLVACPFVCRAAPYEGGVWKVHVELPEAYPYKSPSIGFINRLYHPNVDEM